MKLGLKSGKRWKYGPPSTYASFSNPIDVILYASCFQKCAQERWNQGLIK